MDLLLRFPTSEASTTPVAVDCPATHSGSVHRLCTRQGWATMHGECRRKMCPAHSIDLLNQKWEFLEAAGELGWALGWSQRPLADWASQSWLQAQRIGGLQISFDALSEGDVATVQCPRPPSGWPLNQLDASGGYFLLNAPSRRLYHTFTGNLTRTCLPQSETWGKFEGACVLQQCPAGPQLLHLGTTDAPLQRKIQLPAVDLGTAIRVDCCPRFTDTGGCADSKALHGMITVACGMDGKWVAAPVHGSCVPLQLSPRMDGDATRAAELYNFLRKSVLNGHLSHTFDVSYIDKPHESKWWSLPSSGVLGGISVTFRGEQRRLAVKTAYRRDVGAVDRLEPAWTVNSLPSWKKWAEWQVEKQETSRGRSLAATARVACRQLGYRAAPLVLPCSALVLLEMAATAPAAVKCSNSSFLEDPIRASYRPGQRHLQGGWKCSHWQNVSNIEHESISLARELCAAQVDSPSRRYPTWLLDEAIDNLEVTPQGAENQMPYSRIITPLDVAPRIPGYAAISSEGQSGARLVASPGSALSACNGNEETLAQCYRAQLITLLENKSHVNAAEDVWGRQQLIFACSNETSNVTDAPWAKAWEPHKTTADGTWVVGDRLPSPASTSCFPRQLCCAHDDNDYMDLCLFNCTDQIVRLAAVALRENTLTTPRVFSQVRNHTPRSCKPG